MQFLGVYTYRPNKYNFIYKYYQDMAPEVLKGEKYTIKADIWSLGVVLYECLFGYCPFEGSFLFKQEINAKIIDIYLRIIIYVLFYNIFRIKYCEIDKFN